MSDSRIQQLLTESGLLVDESADLLDVLVGLDDLVGTTAPSPSPELAALLEVHPAPVTTLRPAAARPSAPRKRALAGVVVLALSGVGATGLSAAANTLPRPLQHHVSQFSRHYLPFDLPEPPERPARSVPQPSATLPSARSTEDPEESSRSLDSRPDAGAPDAPVDQGSHATQGGQGSQGAETTAPHDPRSSASAPPTTAHASSSKPSPSAGSQGASPSAGHDDRGDDDAGHDDAGHGDAGHDDRGHGKGNAYQEPTPTPASTPATGPSPRPTKDKGSGKDRPRPSGGQEDGQGGGGSEAPMPTLPVPPPPLPDLPPTPDLPRTGEAGDGASG